MIEVFKIIYGFAAPIMEDFFLLHENTHNIRKFQAISNKSKKRVRYCLETVKNRTPLQWANLPEKYKAAPSLNSFKTKIKTCLSVMQDLSTKFRIFISSIRNRAF